jgi:hypothetical protein
LNSFQMYPANWPGACPGTTTMSCSIEIRNASSTVVFLKPYSATITCGGYITIPVTADLVKGNGYTISLVGLTTNASSWQQIFNGFPVTQAGVATVTGPTANYTTMGNLSFTSNNFTVTPNCPSRVKVDRLCSLPVELISFTASGKGSKNYLQWTTASEYNSDYFAIERSSDGLYFHVIGAVKAMGNSSDLVSYYFTDERPATGINYYRLMQYDINGDKYASDVRVVNTAKGENIKVYPNPTGNQFNVMVPASLIGSVLTVTDVLGREIYKAHMSNADFSLGSDWAKGPYVLHWVSGNDAGTELLIKE